MIATIPASGVPSAPVVTELNIYVLVAIGRLPALRAPRVPS